MDIEKILENEKEWRRFVVQEHKELRKEVEELRKDLGIFKIKTFGFLSSLVAAVELAKSYFK